MNRSLHILVSAVNRSLATALLLSCVLAAAVGVPSALAARGHVFSKAFGSPGSGSGQFDEPSAVAVNEASGDVYVLDRGNGRVEYFSSTGAYLGQFNGESAPTGQLLKPNGIAVDNACVQHKPVLTKATKPSCEEFDPSNGDVYVIDFEHNVIDKFDAVGDYLNQLVYHETPPHELSLPGVAVDRSGSLWVSVNETQGGVYTRFEKFDNSVANHLSSTVPATGEFGGNAKSGLAVDAKETLYSGYSFEAGIKLIDEFNDEGELLKKGLDEEDSVGVAAELPSNDVYVDNLSSVGRFESSGVLVERIGSGRLPTTNCGEFFEPAEQEHCERSGVAVDSVTGDVYVAVGPNDEVQRYVLEPPGAPTVAGESVSDVTGGSATFAAEVNPRGASTEYRVEYGPCETPVTCASSPYAESVPRPDGQAGSAFETQAVSVHVQDLVAGTTYHFRVAAHNEINGKVETVAGEEVVFSTQPASVFELLDGREWEMVSPADKNGARIMPILEGPVQAAAGGGAMAFEASKPTETGALGNSNLMQVLATRGPDGWGSRDIAIPHLRATAQSIGQGEEYRMFSKDLSRVALQPFGSFDPGLSEEASEQTPYLRSNYASGHTGELCTAGCYRPLVTAGNTSEGAHFGEEGKCPPQLVCGPNFVDASSDLSHIVLESSVGLTSTPGDKGGLYEWSGGGLQLVSILPDGKPASLVSQPVLGSEGVSRQTISVDGDRLVWSSNDHHLYMREVAEGRTLELDEGLSSGPVYQTASADGSKVFFSDGGNLYVYYAETETAKLLTVPLSGEGVGLQRVIVGASEDGSYIYFTAGGRLTADAVKGHCGAGAVDRECNLYELHEEGGVWQVQLVTVLSSDDYHDWNVGLQELTSRVSPDGRYLVFMSDRSLTGYDNHDAVSGKPDEEVYLYNADTSRVVCVSCNPTGARPNGLEFEKLDQNGLVTSQERWPLAWFAASVPGWTPLKTGGSLYQSRYLSDSGRVFFNSSDALVPQDVNGTEDVYEYEPPGVGSCTTASLTYSERSGGCVALVSSGGSPEESAFLDASETGGDVFFLTAAKLASQDYDSALDVYDAHECSTGAPCFAAQGVVSPPCTTEASCRPSPSPQPAIFGSPASATFTGIGNASAAGSETRVTARGLTRAQKLAAALKACRKKLGKRRRACEQQARTRYAAAGRAGRVAKGERGVGR